MIKSCHVLRQRNKWGSAPTISQPAAIEALKNGDPDIEMMASEYNRRRKYILNGLCKIGIECFEAEGAF